ncbi:MAG TPA: glycosyltransferase [bacterium]|nr:glycosyltransferase [bacterium]HOL46913.1 glycosyltransferase [bacterium]HPQ18325.1 glycosyltransferase [bacterium]
MLSIVIPTLNEEKNLEILLPKIKDYCNEIIIVDDGSTDNTIGVGKKYNCKILERKNKFGVGSAVIDGAKIASYDNIAIVDGDLSHPVEVLKSVYLIEQNIVDIVKFSRFIGGGGMDNKLRWHLQGIYNRIMNILAGTRVSDFTGGFLLAKKECFDYHSTAVHGEWIIEFMYNNRNKRIAEVPYVYGFRKYGVSKFSGKKDIIRMFRYLYFIFYYHLKITFKIL